MLFISLLRTPKTLCDTRRTMRCIEYFFHLKISLAQSYVMLQEAYEESALPYSTARRWFKEGRQLISKEGGPGVSVTALTNVNINTAAVIVREERRIALRDL
ncbi:hypothetical protein AVEN_259241-1 [Araneus ventricosus]|uniref:Mos1 transposase HTH domain-containing protein n=1 Tax=Araneus ventricosus TaxID=182803 RepID=A0A4Y2I5H3_ARAVE|nr:hypothetical protein AVEN_259241-1 [Araneus ventricosus]